MGLFNFKPLLLLLWLLVLVSDKSLAIEARTISSFPSLALPSPHKYSKIFATLGVVCKCCDGGGDKCMSSWSGSCSKLQCLPWKFA